LTTSKKEKIPTEKGSYIDFYQNIFEVIREGKSLLISPTEALDVIIIIEKILLSFPIVINTLED